jgi:hypothetical protein
MRSCKFRNAVRFRSRAVDYHIGRERPTIFEHNLVHRALWSLESDDPAALQLGAVAADGFMQYAMRKVDRVDYALTLCKKDLGYLTRIDPEIGCEFSHDNFGCDLFDP